MRGMRKRPLTFEFQQEQLIYIQLFSYNKYKVLKLSR